MQQPEAKCAPTEEKEQTQMQSLWQSTWMHVTFGDRLMAGVPKIVVRTGMTDYVDLVHPEDFEGPLARFIDKFSRPGLALRVQVSEPATGKVVENAIYTVFQRYTRGQLLVLCRSHMSGLADTRPQAFAEITGANTAVDERAMEIIQGLVMTAHLGGHYDTEDGKLRVRLVGSGPSEEEKSPT